MLMLKRLFMIVTACFFLIPALAAHGDVVTEPDNDFYKRHASKIIYLGRSFTANGKNGSVAVKTEPGAETDIAKIQNGKVTYVQYSCLYDKAFWGFTFEYNGWIRLDETLVLYDYVAFEEDHLNEFYPYSGGHPEIMEARSAVAWPWPGANTYLWTFEDLDMRSFRIAHVYKDKDGREWGFIPYLYSSKNIWICLSDPLNRGIPAFKPAREPEAWVSETAHTDIKRSDDPVVMLIAALVIALVVGTAVLINVFWKPNTAKPDGKSAA